MFNRQSKIGNRKLIDLPASGSRALSGWPSISRFPYCSIDPLAALRNKDRQFFHHELGFANRTDHVSAGRGVPFLRHFFAGVTAPALNVGLSRENMPTNFRQIAIVQP